jgi:hypothetical protein
MLFAAVGAWVLADRKPVMNVPPVIRTDMGRIDANHLDSIDNLQYLLDFGPAGDMQIDLAARTHERQRRVRISRSYGPQNVDPRDDGAIRVRGPTHISKDRVGLNSRIRRLRSITRSDAAWPKRSQCSICFSSQISSTWVYGFGFTSGMGTPSRAFC